MPQIKATKRNIIASVFPEKHQSVYTLIIVASILILVVGIFIIWNALRAVH